MTRRIAISSAVFALVGLTACSSSVPVRVNLAPIHATLAPATATQASAAAASPAGK